MSRPNPFRAPAGLRPRSPNSRHFSAIAFLLAAQGLHAQLPSGTWQYQWGDDFSGTAVDTTKWNVASPSWTMPNSLSAAAADKVVMGSGVLTLDATRTATSGTVQFSSGSVSTYQKVNITGGYIEARIWLPDTPGSWPALWGLYTGWPPEMDIMEYPIDTAAGSGYAQDEYHTAFHYTNASGAAAAGAGKVNPGNAGDLGGAWHTFGANWVGNSSVTFYFDGAQVSSFTSAADVAEMVSMYFILDYAVGGWPGEPSASEWPLGFTDHTKVDWIRVWKSAAAKASDWVNTGTGTYMLWDTAADWTNGVPNLGGVTAGFGTVTPGEQQIDWSGTRTLSVMNLTGATRYRFGWPDDRLVLGFGSGGSIQPAINVTAASSQSHEINAGLEWSGDLAINHDSAQPLLLTGVVRGGNGININGAGVVSFDGGATYSGNTVIDSGTAGPGVARARLLNALGIGGTVTIGASGNATTGRLELENGALVSNAISLCGRTNDSAGIVNNGGTNAISGTVSAQSGGDRYWIQSDAGKLRLTHPVSLSCGATGTRAFTLRGAGDGEVNGAIQNGSAATVNVVKSGGGTWTLSSANSYSGTTTVSGGTLVVNGSTGAGATTVGSGSTLAGRGTVNQSLAAQGGATVRVGGEGMPLVFARIDDFSSYATGSIGAVPNTTGNVWTGVFDGTANARIVSDAGNNAFEVNGTNSGSSPWRGAITDLRSAYTDGFSLRDGATGTYFLRVKSTSSSATDFIFGLTDEAASTASPPGNDTSDPWNEYAVTLSVSNGYLRGFGATLGDVNVAPIASNQWLNVWVVVDNAAKSFRVATSTGTAAGVLSPTVFGFGRRAAGGAALVTFGLHERLNATGRIDDLYFARGVALGNPLAASPALAGETLTVQNGFTLAAGASLEFGLAGAGLCDRLVVGGAFDASGGLKVTVAAGGAPPALGDSYDLFDAAGGTVAFSSLALPALATGLKWDTSSIAAGVLTVVADPSAYAGWVLLQGFASGTDGRLQDPDGDGLANLVEYATGTNPKSGNGAALACSITGGTLAVTFPRNVVASDITLALTASDDLSGPWTELARGTGGGAFAATAAGVGVAESGSGATRTVVVTDSVFTSDPAHPRRFVRLEVAN